VNYAKLLEISSFFTWHIFLEVGKTHDMPSKIWQTLGDALSNQVWGRSPAKVSTMIDPSFCYNNVHNYVSLYNYVSFHIFYQKQMMKTFTPF